MSKQTIDITRRIINLNDTACLVKVKPMGKRRGKNIFGIQLVKRAGVVVLLDRSIKTFDLNRTISMSTNLTTLVEERFLDSITLQKI